MKSALHIRQFVPTMLVLALFSVIPHTLISQTKTPNPKAQSCKALVQKFYNAYVGPYIMASENIDTNAPTFDPLDKPELFDKKLYDLLKDDADAQQKVEGEIVGLDFDPFLATQDASPKFHVIHVKITGTQCRALVRGIQDGKMREIVIPQLQASGNSWIFTNFYYNFDNDDASTSTNDLISLLKENKAEREKEKAKQ